MKLDAFSLDLSSSRTYSKTETTTVSQKLSFVNLLDGSARGRPLPPRELQAVSASPEGAVSLTDQFKAELTALRQIMTSVMEELQQRMQVCGVCRLTRVGQVYLSPVFNTTGTTARAWEFTRTTSVTFEEVEQTLVAATGTVRTGDGRDIDFSLDLAMERQFFRETTLEQTASGVVLVDPLVIRTGAPAPVLGGGQFSFDLDLDGSREDLPLPGPGWGFLALDLDGDGRISDGRELFGPATGSGFGELARYDLDHNDWIDENDGIFDRLSLWEQGEAGMTLTRIQEAGIGAIYLASVPSRFDLTGPDNALLGRVARTSLALTETGEAIPVQEVELGLT